MRIGFIGAGAMAGAIVRGTIAAGTPADHILLTGTEGTATRLAQATGAIEAASNSDVVAGSDVVVLAVKPHVVPLVATEISEAVRLHNPLIASIAAGITTTRLEGILPEGARVVRVMPNMAATVGEAMSALCAGSQASDGDLARARALMDSVGRTIVLEEKDFSTFTALSGSSPAFVFAFIEALARAGVLGGIPKAQAVDIVAQAVLGSARTVQVEAARRAAGDPGRTPADLIDAVSSPGGTTVAGLVAMERAGFSDAVIRGFEATVARDRQLGA
ncbi:pyrroline-5-carboxylate reductase [Actinomyces oricola]|uniref:pyrroline-5-carboxylate reductase n=1 Tax=Actinomyces oricola TaxID=206043 RepID=UPI000FFEBCC9|nr:pyrroline-5-carboxylate reductase [Actinomyces oricola]